MKIKLGKYFIEVAKEKKRIRHLTPKQITGTITDMIPLIAVAAMAGQFRAREQKPTIRDRLNDMLSKKEWDDVDYEDE